MTHARHHIGLATMILLLFSLASNAMAARYFVYELPDGTRMISDHRINKATHKLIASSRKVDGTGKIAAKKIPARPITFNKPQHVDRWDDLIIELARRHKVDVALVKAVVHTESYFNYRAISHAGASGLMQLMPETAAKYGVHDIDNPYENLDAGIQHLRYLLTKYHWNLKYALAAYNAGEKAVYYYNGVPPYKETREYVQKVLAYRDYYKQPY